MVQSVQRAMCILRAASDGEGQPVTLRQLAQKSGLNDSTCAHLVSTLTQGGYLEQVSRAHGYIVGPMAYRVARHGPYRRDLADAGSPLVHTLARRMGETTVLLTLASAGSVVLCQAEGQDLLRLREDAVPLEDAYCTAAGRLLLAHATPQTLEMYIEQNGLPGSRWSGVEARIQLSARLARIREKPVCTLREIPGIVQLACGVRQAGKVCAALGMLFPDMRATDQRVRRGAELLIQIAGQIEASAG